LSNKILIITGGNIDPEFLSNRMNNECYQMIIAADHGLATADLLGIKLDYIVGDFDSISEKVLNKYRDSKTVIKTFPTQKDKTDTEIALELALSQQPDEVDLIGATGNRLDHVMANIHLLTRALRSDTQAYMIDTNNKIYLKNKNFTIQKEDQYGNYVSLLPLCDKVSGLTLKGFKYPLNGITYEMGSSLGVSNEISDSEASVEMTEGILVVIESID